MGHHRLTCWNHRWLSNRLPYLAALINTLGGVSGIRGELEISAGSHYVQCRTYSAYSSFPTSSPICPLLRV